MTRKVKHKEQYLLLLQNEHGTKQTPNDLLLYLQINAPLKTHQILFSFEGDDG